MHLPPPGVPCEGFLFCNETLDPHDPQSMLKYVGIWENGIVLWTADDLQESCLHLPNPVPLPEWKSFCLAEYPEHELYSADPTLTGWADLACKPTSAHGFVNYTPAPALPSSPSPVEKEKENLRRYQPVRAARLRLPQQQQQQATVQSATSTQPPASPGSDRQLRSGGARGTRGRHMESRGYGLRIPNRPLHNHPKEVSSFPKIISKRKPK